MSSNAEKQNVTWQLLNLDRSLKKLHMQLEMEQCDNPMVASHGFILGYLMQHRDEDIYQKTIEKRFHMPRSTATGLLQEMEKNDMIRRESVEHDARLKKIVISEHGEEFCKRSWDNIMTVESIARDGITEEEQAVFQDIVTRMLTNVESKLDKKGGADIC